MFIYKITNLINSKVYVGQTTKSVERRWKEHCKPSSRCTVLVNAIKKYGKDNFKIEIIETCVSVEDLNTREIQLISELNCLIPNGYNIVKGGNRGPTLLGEKNPWYNKCGILHPLYGKKRSQDFIDRIKITSSGSNNGMFGVRGKDHPSSIKIKCLTNNKIYEAVQDASRELNIDSSSIVKVLKGKRVKAGNHIFQYVEE